MISGSCELRDQLPAVQLLVRNFKFSYQQNGRKYWFWQRNWLLERGNEKKLTSWPHAKSSETFERIKRINKWHEDRMYLMIKWFVKKNEKNETTAFCLMSAKTKTIDHLFVISCNHQLYQWWQKQASFWLPNSFSQPSFDNLSRRYDCLIHTRRLAKQPVDTSGFGH